MCLDVDSLKMLSMSADITCTYFTKLLNQFESLLQELPTDALQQSQLCWLTFLLHTYLVKLCDLLEWVVELGIYAQCTFLHL